MVARDRQAREDARAAFLASQQSGDTGMSVSVYGKPITFEYREFFRSSTDPDHRVFMVANGQPHWLNSASAYADVGVASDLANVQVASWMKSERNGPSF
jgi:hypothetical protein